jgi:hypothetical protein
MKTDERSIEEGKELLLRRAAFGKQCEQFMVSDVGRYLLARAEDEAAAGFNEFKRADPRDGKMLEKVQNKILRAEGFKQWLEDAVVDGLAAFNVLQEGE